MRGVPRRPLWAGREGLAKVMITSIHCNNCTMRDGSDVMTKSSVFSMKIEPELRDAFLAEAEAVHRPASQIMREMMRDFIKHQREARDYEAFLGRKVAAARISARAGLGRSNEEVEANFAARRAALLSSDEA